jgi:hypothetical protein
VSNFRWGVIGAIAAFFISICLGLLSGVSVFNVFLRALVFSAVFFGFGFGLRFIINSFFPELLFGGDDSAVQDSFAAETAPRISITLDSTGEYAVPELYKAPGDANELGNIEDLISGYFKPRPEEPQESRASGIDRMREAGYNVSGSSQDALDETMDFDDVDSPSSDKAPEERPVFTPSFGDDSGLGGLPDLDMMAMAFSGGGGPPAPSGSFGPASAVPSVGADEEVFQPDTMEDVPVMSSSRAGNKPQPLEGDFDPKSLAEGIRTVLNKDK